MIMTLLWRKKTVRSNRQTGFLPASASYWPGWTCRISVTTICGTRRPRTCTSLTGDFHTIGEVLGHTLAGIGASLGLSMNFEAITARYIDVRLEQK